MKRVLPLIRNYSYNNKLCENICCAKCLLFVYHTTCDVFHILLYAKAMNLFEQQMYSNLWCIKLNIIFIPTELN